MYTQLQIEKFRGLHSVTLPDLKRINLLVGRNNTGKTSLLEALFLMTGATNPISAMSIAQLRGQRFGGDSIDPVWRPFFYGMDTSNAIRLSANWKEEQSPRTLTITALPVTTFTGGQEPQRGGGVASSTSDSAIGGLQFLYKNAIGREMVTKAVYDSAIQRIEAPPTDREDFVRSSFVSARSYPSLERDAQQFSYLLKIKREDEVVEALKIVEPRIQRIEVISEATGPSVYIDIGLDALVPIAVSGEGFVRLFSMIVELTSSRGGVLLIDEIDSGLHHSVMGSLWKVLGEMAESHDVQIFGTSHNDDMIRSALRELNALPGGVGLYRLDATRDGHRVAAYDRDAIEGVLDSGLEVRA